MPCVTTDRIEEECGRVEMHWQIYTGGSGPTPLVIDCNREGLWLMMYLTLIRI